MGELVLLDPFGRPIQVEADNEELATQSELKILQDLLSLRGDPTKRTTKSLLEGFSTIPWVHGLADRIGTATAQQSWRLFVETTRGGTVIKNSSLRSATFQERNVFFKTQTDFYKEVTENIFLDMFNVPNSRMTGGPLRRLTQIHIDLAGEAFWLKKRDNLLNVPRQLWPFPPHWVTTRPSPDYPFFDVSSRGYYESVKEEDMVWFQQLDPLDPYGAGSGIGAALADEFDTCELAAKHVKSELWNKAIPPILITAEGLTRGSTTELEQRWNQKSQGPYNRGRPMFLNRKVDVKELSRSFESLQLTDLRKDQRDIAMQIFHMPPEMMGVIENANRSTIAASYYLFSRGLILPRLEFMREVLQWRLIPDFDDRLILHFDSPVEEDNEFNLRVIQAASWAFEIDEIRAAAGRSPDRSGQGFKHAIPNKLVFGTLGEVEPVPDDDTDDTGDAK